MARKPLISGDSLELLLDTMCNTFGGVMFIAIALVVISFFIPKIVSEIETEVTDAQKIEQLQNEIQELQSKLKKQQIERSLKEELLKRFKNHPHLEKIQELARLKEENHELILLTSSKKAEKQAFLLSLKKLKNDKLSNQNILTQQILTLHDLTDKNTIVEKENEDNDKIIQKLNEELNKEKETRKIGVTPRSETERTPFIVILKGNKIFRCHNYTEESLYDGTKLDHSDDVKGEVGAVDGPDNSRMPAILFKPEPGKGSFIYKDADNSMLFDRLFSKVDKSKRFVWLMVNDDSFEGFIKLRTYLRNKGFKIYWYPVEDEFFLTISDEGTYEDGE